MSDARLINILLVEDNPSDVLLARFAFEAVQAKINITVAEDGEKALDILFKKNEYAEQATPNLILLDLNIPKIEGRTVLKKIKTTQVLKRIPVIVLSGSKAEKDINEIYDLHANGYIIKPIGGDQLKQTVKAIDAFWFSLAALPKNEEPPI